MPAPHSGSWAVRSASIVSTEISPLRAVYDLSRYPSGRHKCENSVRAEVRVIIPMVFLHLLYLLLLACLTVAPWRRAQPDPGTIRFLRRPDASRGEIALVCAVLAAAGAWASGSADAAVSVSSHWAGYAVVPCGSRASAFSRVSGSWAVPTATCSGRGETYAAAWVGLGGFHKSSRHSSRSARTPTAHGRRTRCTRLGMSWSLPRP